MENANEKDLVNGENAENQQPESVAETATENAAEAITEPTSESSTEATAPTPEETTVAPLLTDQENHPAMDHEENLPVVEEHQEEIEHEPLENFGDYNKEQLAGRMEEFSDAADFNSVKNKVNAARDAFNHIVSGERAAALSKFLEDGGLKEEFDYKDAVEDRFNEAYKKFNKRRSEYILSQEKIRNTNLKQKQEILNKMKHIIQNEEDMSKAFNEFHELQAQWRGIGPVPPQNINDLWMTYRLYIERFYDYIKINRELQDLDQKKNLEMKIQLCEQAEELMLEPSLNKAMQEASQLQTKWKDIGIVPRDKRTEVWTRFKAAVDKVFERRKAFMDELKGKHSANLEAKNTLIAKAEELIATPLEKHSQWQEKMKAVLELQQEWRKIGPTDKQTNEEVWKKFKSVSDQFFKNKDDFYQKKKQEYAANMQAKTELCIAAEALKDSHDWKNTGNELIRLQQEWKKIGPVGSSEKNDRIWNRFRAACDNFFQTKKAHFADQDQAQEVNLVEKEKLITEVEQFVVGENAQEALEQLKDYQRKFTDIGLVPLAKKDDIYNRFRKAIQVHFDGLKANPDYRQGFRTRNEHGGNNSGGGRSHHHSSQQPAASGDERGIVHKMNKLKEEVTVLENNIGFFAKSKNANPIKQEYEEKIKAAKEEIDKLKQKLKEIKSAS